MQAKIPATVITGFLGSGKTTLLSELLKTANRRIAVIVNEFGELGIDGELIKGCGLACDEQGDEALFEMNNGCLCCTVQEEFVPVMQQLIERRHQIDHLVIETSGLALPKPLVQAFNWPEIKNVFTVDAVISVVDGPAAAAGVFAHNPKAIDAQRQQDDSLDHESPLHELFEDQLIAADLVLVSKTDLMSKDEIESVHALARKEIAAGVQIIDMVNGNVPAKVLLGQQKQSEDRINSIRDHHDAHHEGDGNDHVHAHEVFDSIKVSLGAWQPEALIDRLNRLIQQQEIYRIKGFVDVPDKKMRAVVHGAGQRFNYYFERPWKDEENRRTELILIGLDLDAKAIHAALG